MFSKFMVVVPIKAEEPPDVFAWIMEAGQKMRGTPRRSYANEEDGLGGHLVKEYLDKEDVELHLGDIPIWREEVPRHLKTSISRE